MKFSNFIKNFKQGAEVYLEDSVLWYCLDMGVNVYLSMTIHERINFKQSYFNFKT